MPPAAWGSAPDGDRRWVDEPVYGAVPVGAIAAVVIMLGATASGTDGVFLAEIPLRRSRFANIVLVTRTRTGQPDYVFFDS